VTVTVRATGQHEVFGARLRRLREEAGLSQEELADRAGLSSHAVSALERGTRTRPYPHTIRSLADALRVGDDERAALIAAVPTRARAAASATAGEVTGAGDVAPTGRSRELPVPTTELLGRERDLERVCDLVRGQRLVTLTGTGGVGKTRLALAVASTVRDLFADGVAWVELAPMLDPGRVLPIVADALDTPPAPGTDPVDAVVARVRDEQTLLVLDNLEHLLDAAPQIAALIVGAPGLTVLVTSRAPLRVRGETEVAVEPLGLPGEADDPPAVRLLLERAGAVCPGWGADPADLAAVEAICIRLAGIPLALEIAAARSRVLDPTALLERLDDALLVGARDLPERQRTMRATLDWSYGLLDEDERVLLRPLSVFNGGFRLDDVEAVVARAGVLPPERVLPLLEGLAEQSLLVTTAGRSRLLEPVAQYARTRLDEEGEWPAAAAAHAAHFLDLVETTAPRYQDGGQVEALARIDLEHPNITAAMERLLADGDHAEVGRFGWALWMYWWLRGHHAHGRRLVEPSLAHDLPPEVRPRAELAAATMCFAMDDVPASRAWWQAAHAHAGDDAAALANATAGIGLSALAVGDLAEARDQFTRAIPIGVAAGPEGDWTVALGHIWLGTVELLEGDADAAVDQIEQGLASARRRGDRLSAYIALYNLSQVELGRGRHDRARRHLEEGMRLSLETGDHANLAYLLDSAAVLEVAEGTHARVPILLGAAQGLREAVGARGYGYYQPDPAAIAAAADDARARLGPDRYDDALDHGRGLPPDQVVALLLGPGPG
jgi:predicted ATPase/transcriptional regulator with XRE-family HTH domain